MGSVADVWQTIISTIVAGVFFFWLKVLHGAIAELRKENIRVRELYQLKSDAVRDQEQIMKMLAEIKQSMERTTERIDRLISGPGGH